MRLVEGFVPGQSQKPICRLHDSLLLGHKEEFKVKNAGGEYQAGHILPIIPLQSVLSIYSNLLPVINLLSHITCGYIVEVITETSGAVTAFNHKVI